jgi:hypothetical protein
VISRQPDERGLDGDPLALEEQAFARCPPRDACLPADVARDGSRMVSPFADFAAVADRIDWTSLDGCLPRRRYRRRQPQSLPKGCTPRWLKLDRASSHRAADCCFWAIRPG